MKRIRRIYYLKKVINPLMMKVYALLVLTLGIGSLVSVQNVIANMPSFAELGSVYRFSVNAFLYTELPVQIVVGATFIIALLLLRDAAKNFFTTPQPERVQA